MLANNVLVGTVEIAPLPRLCTPGIGFASPFTKSWLPLAATVPDPAGGGLIGGQHGQGIPTEIESIILWYVFYMLFTDINTFSYHINQRYYTWL